MDKQQFISYIKEPENLGKDSLDAIEVLSEKFPYCQSLQILHLLNLKMINHVMYSEQLKSTAAHIADRTRLRELIRGMQEGEERGAKSEERRVKEKDQSTTILDTASRIQDQPSEEVPSEVDETLISAPSTQYPEPVVPVIEQDEEARLLRLKQILEDRLKEIADKKGEATEEESILSKEELIEKFIREEPSISRPKTDFFDPVKVAKSSREEQTGLVTETLARIHIQQGNLDKAIEIYRKLSLNFPEKSGYFAAQIKKLSTEN